MCVKDVNSLPTLVFNYILSTSIWIYGIDSHTKYNVYYINVCDCHLPVPMIGQLLNF